MKKQFSIITLDVAEERATYSILNNAGKEVYEIFVFLNRSGFDWSMQTGTSLNKSHLDWLLKIIDGIETDFRKQVSVTPVS
jgi:hypothetical protein